MKKSLNPVKRFEEIKEERENRHLEIDPEQMYHCVEVLTWGQLQTELNYWAQHGWRLHTVRDGLRASAGELGYRLILERVVEDVRPL